MTEQRDATHWRDKVDAIQWGHEHTDHYLLARAMANRLDFPETSPSEIAPNVLEALQTINEMACYACEEDIDSRYAMLLRIGETARAILNAAPQASPSVAPAVHVGPAVAAPASAPSASVRISMKDARLIQSVLESVHSELRSGNVTIWADNVRDSRKALDEAIHG